MAWLNSLKRFKALFPCSWHLYLSKMRQLYLPGKRQSVSFIIRVAALFVCVHTLEMQTCVDLCAGLTKFCSSGACFCVCFCLCACDVQCMHSLGLALRVLPICGYADAAPHSCTVRSGAKHTTHPWFCLGHIDQTGKGSHGLPGW